MPVIINNNLLEPAPYVNISKEIIVAGNQTKLGQTYQLTIEGNLVAWMGSPQGGSLVGSSWGGYQNLFWQGSAPAPSETVLQFHKLYNIEAKQRALEYLFSINGSTIEWESPDGSQPLKTQFKNAKITFQEGDWAQLCKYTVTAECDYLYLNGNPIQDASFSGLIQQASENWNIQLGEVVKTFNVQHTVNCQGKIAFDSNGNITQPAWQNARDFVLQNLVLGYSGVSSYSNIPGQTIFQNSVLASGNLNLKTYSSYNYSIVEEVDELGGSVNITESWLLAPQESGTHIYSVNTQRISQDPYTTVVSQIQGTIHGNYIDLFDYDSRLANATYVWNQLAGPTGLLNFIIQYNNTNYATGIQPFNLQPRNGSVDFNYNDGTISYNYEFSNTLYNQDAFATSTVARKTSTDSYLTTFSVNGNIKGRRYDGDIDPYSSFDRAYAFWITVSGNNFDYAYQKLISNIYFPEASGMGIQHSPISMSVEFSRSQGEIIYSLEYNNRINDFNVSGYQNNVIDEWNVSKHFNITEGVTTYSLQGQVQGLNVTDTNPRYAKYGAATGYYYTYVKPNIYSRVTGVYNVSLPSADPVTTEESFYPVQGNVQYNFQFNNWPAPLLSGVLSEVITVNESNYNTQINVIGVIPVLGRRQGPVIQNMQTSQIKTRSVSIEAILLPASGVDLLSSFNTKPNYDAIVLTLTPTNGYCTNWSDSWNFRDGHYSLQAEWTYQ